MKPIAYDDGLLNFRLPQDWVEEEEDDGTALYYPEGVLTRALRLQVMQFQSPKDVSQEFCVDMLQNMGKEEGGEVIALDTGNAVLQYQQEAQERKNSLLIHNWEMASPAPPHTVRLAIFSYTILAADADSAEVQADLAMLNEEIRNARFG